MKKQKGIKNYFIKVLNAMAQGLFASLIIGLIISQIGVYTKLEILVNAGKIAQFLMGPAIGAAVALSVKASPLAILASIVSGALGAGTITQSSGVFTLAIGDPASALIAALVGAEISKLIQGKTKLDILLVPAIVILSASLVSSLIGPYVSLAMKNLGGFINMLTNLHPIPMGILLSVSMGIILTLPISSAAIAISLGLSGIAAGASVVGCSCHMIGFAVMSYRQNGIGGFIAQGLGTSMLQIGNIIRNPWIILPPVLASAILGPISSFVFKMENTKIGAGMGTSGLVGQIGAVNAMGENKLILIAVMHIVLPAILSYMFYFILSKLGRIKESDLKLKN